MENVGILKYGVTSGKTLYDRYFSNDCYNKQILDQLEVLLYGIKTAFACKNFTRAETLLTNAATICTTFSGCDCGCDCSC